MSIALPGYAVFLPNGEIRIQEEIDPDFFPENAYAYALHNNIWWIATPTQLINQKGMNKHYWRVVNEVLVPNNIRVMASLL